MKFSGVPLSRSTFCKRKGRSGVEWNELSDPSSLPSGSLNLRRLWNRLQSHPIGSVGTANFGLPQLLELWKCFMQDIPYISPIIPSRHEFPSLKFSYVSSHKTYRISRPLLCGWTSKPCSKHGDRRIALDGGISTFLLRLGQGQLPQSTQRGRGMRRVDSRRDLGKSWTWNPTRSTHANILQENLHGTSCIWLQTSHSSSRALHRNFESNTRTSPLPSPTASWCPVQLMDHTADGSTMIFIKAQSCENHLAVTREILAAMGNGCFKKHGHDAGKRRW